MTRDFKLLALCVAVFLLLLYLLLNWDETVGWIDAINQMIRKG